MNRLHDFRAACERLLHPSRGTCGRCRRPWACVAPHITHYTEARGCFPLCEACWRALDHPGARLPYYRALWRHWLHTCPPVFGRLDEWDERVGSISKIEAAVWRGL